MHAPTRTIRNTRTRPAIRIGAPALAALLVPLAAWSARPLVSETADAQARGSCEFEPAVARTTARGQASATGLDMLVACGIGLDTQLGAGYGRSRSGGQTEQSLTLSGKTNLAPVQDGRIGWAIAYAAAFDKAPGSAWRHGGTRLYGVGTLELTANLLGHLNLGWQRSAADRQTSTTWSAGVEGDGPLRWAADVFGDDRSRPWLSAGLVWPLADRFTANIAYAQQFERVRVRQWSLGVKLDF